VDAGVDEDLAAVVAVPLLGQLPQLHAGGIGPKIELRSEQGLPRAMLAFTPASATSRACRLRTYTCRRWWVTPEDMSSASPRAVPPGRPGCPACPPRGRYSGSARC
jgi:hypothetical protein